MRGALLKAAEELATWRDDHPESCPPTIQRITDGIATDDDPEETAVKMSELGADDGAILFFNLRVS